MPRTDACTHTHADTHADTHNYAHAYALPRHRRRRLDGLSRGVHRHGPPELWHAGGWPPDSAPVPDGNCVVQIDDVAFANSRFGAQIGDAIYTGRAEIASQDGTVAIDDVAAFASRFGQSC